MRVVSPAAMGAAAMLGLTAGCAPEYELGAVPVPVGHSAAVQLLEDPQQNVRQEVFEFGAEARTPIADYLFVLDNSSSMQLVIERVRKAFAALAEEDPFPAQARVAVMGTIPSRLDNFNRPHPATRHSRGLADDPGFLRMVSATGIDRFRDRGDERAVEQFAIDGCNGPWFGPEDTNAAGTPCIVAHTQISMEPVRIEAGLLAFKQGLQKKEKYGKSMFREGAAANVIFVSDTHDPGHELDFPGVSELIEARPDFDELVALVDRNNVVSSFRVHAIAPKSECGEPWAPIGQSYFDVAEVSGGQILDICTAEDYAALIRDIAQQGAVMQRAVFPLAGVAKEVTAVRVDGEHVPFTVTGKGDVVVVDSLSADHRAEVVIDYRFAPPRQPKKRAAAE